jgi:hypothetical protein
VTSNTLAELVAAEGKAEALLTAIEEQRLILPGRSEIEVDRDIYELAHASFGVTQHWHKRNRSRRPEHGMHLCRESAGA